MGYWDRKEPKTPEPEEEQEDSLEALEGDCLKEMDEVSKGFRERMKAENERFRDMCDTEYWFCVCFTSRAQKEELLRALRMDPDEKYVDGREMAKAVRKALRTPDLEFAKVRPYDKDFSDRAMDV